MTIRFGFVLSALAIAGCATASKTYAPDGRVAYSINCSGAALNWGLCYEKAGEICQERGYDVISANGDSSPVVTASPQSVFGSTIVNRSMLVACK